MTRVRLILVVDRNKKNQSSRGSQTQYTTKLGLISFHACQVNYFRKRSIDSKL